MCGLAGIIGRAGEPVDVALVQRMTDAVTHRGPDGAGLTSFRNLSLGHRRLAIVETSAAGAQPMNSSDGRLCIVYNGEIYNHIELRAELSALGHLFNTASDTEVILAAYAQWGPQCLHRFNGMWAIALLDRGTNQVFLARDRFGVKPLHYVDTSRFVAFGSEIKQLLPLASRRPDEHAVLDFLHFGLQDHLTDRTSFAEIRKLPAGTWMMLDLEAPVCKVVRWYTPRPSPSAPAIDPDESARRFMALLDDAVRLRLRADVPVGTCLSGGLDSSTIATLASPRYLEAAGRPFSAICAASEHLANDESPFAQSVATHAGLELTCVRPSYEDFVDTLEPIHLAQDEPVGGPSLTMQWCVMRAARSAGLPVLLDGQGGDEVLLGYDRYVGNAFWEDLRHRGLLRALKMLRAASAVKDGMNARSRIRFVLGTRFTSVRRAGHHFANRALTRPHPMAQVLDRLCDAASDPQRVQGIEIESTNLPALLRFEDRNSMHHSIETRLPFLDWRVVEAGLALPTGTKLRGGWSKWPLRAQMGADLPEAIRWSRRKIGFEAPESIWLSRHRRAMDAEIRGCAPLRELAGLSANLGALEAIDARLRWRLFSTACWIRLRGVG
jgi:asparagine synthase (glutamine-hydrolysing)